MTRKERQQELDRFTEASRDARSGLSQMLLYVPSGGLRGKELPGAEAVLRGMRDQINAVMDALFPPRVPKG